MKHVIGGIAVCSLLLGVGVPAFAQQQVQDFVISEQTSEEELDAIFDTYLAESIDAQPNTEISIDENQGVGSCFDHYTFNSVEAQIVPQTKTVSASTPITFTTTLFNNNPYPVVDGVLYVKIFSVKNASVKEVNGPDVVDQFVVRDQISLNAQESKTLTFDWKVPVHATAGEYRVATFFLSQYRYNLLGLSFTDDVIGSSAPFTVLSDKNEGVFFDKASVRMNNESYAFAAFPPRFFATEPVRISATLVNTTNAPVRVPVSFKTFYWDAFALEEPLVQTTQLIDVPANGTQDVSFTVTDATYPVYLSELLVQYQDTKSILNPRFVRPDVSRLRINMPGIKQYPITSDAPIDIFACLHNTVDGVVNGRLVLTVLNPDNEPIHQYTYVGNVNGDMMGVVDTFTSTVTLYDFTLRAELYQNDVLIETVDVVYACDALQACDVQQAGSNDAWWNDSKIYIPSTIVSIIGIIVIVMWRGFRNKQKKQ